MPQDPRNTTPATPLKALAGRWWIALVLVAVGGGAGAGYGSTGAPTYTGEARVAVGSESLDARIVAGYSVAANQLASDISRYVNDAQAQAQVQPLLGDLAGQVSTIAASPIPSSSVIRIEVQASSAKAASAGAQAVAQQLSDQVNAVSGESADTLLQQYTDLSNQVATAQQASDDAKGNLASVTAARSTQAEIDAAKAAAEQATSALDVLQVQQLAMSQRYRSAVTSTPAAAGLRIVRTGQLESDDRSSSIQKFGLVGAVVGLLLALVVAVLLDRRRVARVRSSIGTGEPTPSDTRDPQTGEARRFDVDAAGSAGSEPSTESQASRS